MHRTKMPGFFYNRSILLFTLIFAISVDAYAQNLPAKQNESTLMAPGIKIDGRYDDWKGGFKAYNKGASTYYAIANDKDNLYLLLKSGSKETFSKILGGGMTLIFKNPSKKKDTITLTYPIIYYTERAQIHNYAIDTPYKSIEVVHDLMVSRAKDIRMTGYNGVDSSISIYNDYGIKAAPSIDTKRDFVIELALPLKYLKAYLKNDDQLSYDIRINPIPVRTNRKPGSSNENELILLQMMADKVGPSFYARLTPDIISGTYTLAK